MGRKDHDLAKEVVSKPPAEWRASTKRTMRYDDTAAEHSAPAPEGLMPSETATQIDEIAKEVGGKAGNLIQEIEDRRRAAYESTSVRPCPDRLLGLEKYLQGADKHARHHYSQTTIDGGLSTAVKHWIDFTLGEFNLSPLRPECVTLSEKDQEFEMRFMQAFADKLIRRGIKPDTVEVYLSLVRGWHIGIRNYAPGVNPQRPNIKLRRQITGMHRLSLKTPKTREAHSTAMFQRMRSDFDRILEQIELLEWGRPPGRSAGPSDAGLSIPLKLQRHLQQLLDWLLKNSLLDDFMMCAALELQTCCVARPGEIYPNKGTRLTAADIKFSFREGILDGAAVGILPLKKRPTDPGYGVKVPMSLVLEQGPYMCALKLVTIAYLWSPVPEGSRDAVALLRFPPGHREAGKPVRYDFVSKRYVTMLRKLKVPKAELFAQCHAPRIIAATTLANAGFTKTMLKTMGRWGSDILFIYTRRSLATMQRMQRALGQVDAGSFIAELFGSEHATEIRPGESKDESDDEATSDEYNSGDDLLFNE